MAEKPSKSTLDEAIDDLYRLPPGEFTARRNALAKTLAGEERERVRHLEKPSAVPWAVNQLYWRDRPLFDRLMKAGAALRTAQIDALEGRRNRVAEATAAHRQAVGAALARATALAHAEDVRPPAEPLTRMLEALSTAPALPAAPGRFTQVLQPSGFEAMAGVVPAGPRAVEDDHRAKPDGGKGRAPDIDRRALEAAVVRARAALEAAEQAEARAAMRLRAARDRVSECEADVRSAQKDVAQAKEELVEAEKASRKASRARE
jgi:hypothetical protein